MSAAHALNIRGIYAVIADTAAVDVENAESGGSIESYMGRVFGHSGHRA
jgi:hypothetical protein